MVCYDTDVKLEANGYARVNGCPVLTNLNGEIVETMEYDEETHRWKVELIDPKPANKDNISHSILDTNLEPLGIHGMNNMLHGNILRLFRNLESIMIYTTSGQGKREYVFDLVLFISKYIEKCRGEQNKIIKCEIKATSFNDYYAKNDGNTEMNQLNESWLRCAYNQHRDRLKELEESLQCKIYLIDTKIVGAREYDEDTLIIE